MSTPLEGLRVLDLSSEIPGAFATRMLADAGANVAHHDHGDEQARVAAHQRTFDTEEYDTTDIFNALQEEAKVRAAPPRPLQRALPAAAQRCANPATRAGRRAWACSMPWTSCRSA